MNDSLSEERKQYIRQVAPNGFVGIFTPMHIPEDDALAYQNRLIELGSEAKKNKLELMADISGEALKRAGFPLEDLTPLKATGVTGLRMDYHIFNQQIADWSHQLKINLNASTIMPNDIDELREAVADFSQVEAWHNYYPCLETGLGKEWCQEKNQWLKTQGFLVQGFVSGDTGLRGPLYQGLPTLKEHRGIHPLAGVLDLLASNTDIVYIGDAGLLEYVQEQFAFFQKEQTVLFRTEPVDEVFYEYILGKHTSRQGDARDVIRSADARFREIPPTPVRNIAKCMEGSITLDNEKYLRYMGEIQLAKYDSPAGEKVNIVAKIIKKKLPLIDQIKAGMNYQFIRKEGR